MHLRTQAQSGEIKSEITASSSGGSRCSRAQAQSVPISAHQCPSVPISAHQCPSVPISAHQCPSVAISGKLRWPSPMAQSGAHLRWLSAVGISGHQRSSAAISGHQRSQRPSAAISGHQRPSAAISGHQRPSAHHPQLMESGHRLVEGAQLRMAPDEALKDLDLGGGRLGQPQRRIVAARRLEE